MIKYKDTSYKPNTLETPENGQIDSQSKVTLLDVIKSLAIAFWLIALLLLISSYQQAHPKNSLPLVAGMGQNIDLSKLVSDTPYRYLLAFFMPEICPATQTGHNDSITPLTQITGLNRHIYNRALCAHTSLRNVTSYGGVTLQNIKAFWQICEAVSNKTESEPRHLLRNFRSNVVLTQNLLGGYHA